MVQRGRRAVYEPEAHAFEKPTPSNETEYRRKVRMFEHCWEITLRGAMLRGLPPGYLVRDRLAPRCSATAAGSCTSSCSRSSVALVGDGLAYDDRARGAAGAVLAAPRPRVPIARYYVLVTWATVVALVELPAARRARDVGGRGGDAVTLGRRPCRRGRPRADEDLFVERAIRNVAGVCDRIHAVDHLSRDRTGEILERLARELDHLEVRRSRDAAESHELLAGYVGTPTWALGVDGDGSSTPPGSSGSPPTCARGRTTARSS